ncbi:hypothetical protein FGO68_gene11998 [Halteria grandinella]|uniref:Uncharacterized protein n=1 Tax=Halteria grandinella TaxID=5974 RepID=A0A8J8NZW6_HALGN|nr:hypothetical protein FGO68_gene11998 [Halteria grandinella]
MLADTEYTRKSGELGTAMFSKPGRRTTYQYLCFDDKHKNDKLLDKKQEESPSEQKKGWANNQDVRNLKSTDYLNHLTKTGFEDGTIDRAKSQAKKREMNDKKGQMNQSPKAVNQRVLYSVPETLKASDFPWARILEAMTEEEQMEEGHKRIQIQSQQNTTLNQAAGAKSSFLSLPRDKCPNGAFNTAIDESVPHLFKYNPRYSIIRRKPDAGILRFEYPSVRDSPKFKRVAATSGHKLRAKHTKSQSQVVFQVKPQEQQQPKQNLDIIRQFTSASNNLLSARQSQTQSERVSPRKVLSQQQEPQQVPSLLKKPQSHTPEIAGSHFYLNFSKMPKRESMFDKSLPGVAHESRFEGKVYLATHQKPKLQAPMFGKQLKRQPLAKESKVIKIITEPLDVAQMLTGYNDHDGLNSGGQLQHVLYQSQVQYDPGFKVTKPNLSLSIPKFEKMKERQLDFLGKPPQEALSIEPEKVAKGTLMQAHFRKKTDVIKFGKQLPRDNKMFFISETHNLDNPEQESSTSFFERINQFDNVKEAIRMIKRGNQGQTPIRTCSHTLSALNQVLAHLECQTIGMKWQRQLRAKERGPRVPCKPPDLTIR